jgi:neutral ceramidase
LLLAPLVAAGMVSALLAGHTSAWREQGAAPAAAWKAGTARVVITPWAPIRLAGYASRSAPSQGVVHDLYARALALESADGGRLVIVSAEVLGFPPPMAARIAGAVTATHGLAPEQFILAATHTHAGPVLRDSLTGSFRLQGEEAERVREYTARIEEQVAALVGRALADLAPARLAFGTGEATFGVNRRVFTPKGVTFGANHEGPSDPDVPVLRVSSPDGTLRAVVFGYACHNTTLTGDFNEVSGDYAGFAQAALEARHPSATALFLTGVAGDIDPQPRGRLDHARAHGDDLVASVQRVLDGTMRPLEPALSARRQEIPLPFELPSRETLEARRTDDNSHRREHAERMLARLDRDGALPPALAYHLQVTRLGALTLVTLAGEVVVDYGLALKRELDGPLWVAAYAHDVPGYIPSERVLREGGYEADFSTVYYNLPGPFAPGLEDRIVSTVRTLARAAR